MSIILYNHKSECSGCWACYNICPKNAIEMLPDEEGFKFPQINAAQCIECGQCLKVCPLKTSAKLITEENSCKHIGIINLQFTDNYGAVIAAAVLEDVVRDIADDCIVNTVFYTPWKQLDSRVKELRDEAKQWGGWKLFLKMKLNPQNHSDAKQLRSKRFTVFRDNYLNLTPRFDDAWCINKEINYVAFITGSDVVWAPRRSDNYRRDGYFLKFAEKGEKRIAYAPSLDHKTDSQLKRLKSVYQENIAGIDAISVREESNREFIQSLTDKKVSVCCDPAFLVEADYYDKMIASASIDSKDEKYIYVYILELNHEIVDYANQLATEKGLKICYYSANHDDYISNSENCVSDGPAEFLYRLKYAEYILTNSYHCVVFSIIFKKKFLSFIRSKNSIKSIDLLKSFNLADRIVTKNKNSDIDGIINFEAVDNCRQKMKEESIAYLKESLKEIAE